MDNNNHEIKEARLKLLKELAKGEKSIEENGYIEISEVIKMLNIKID